MKPLNSYSKIVVLTGAGISAESGLLTFRDNGGLWEGHRVEDVATPEAFVRSPETVQHFYNERRRKLIEETGPNAAHQALAEFEHNFDGDFLLVTQNVDDLHERAGSKNLIHMHGELRKSRCTHCSAVSPCDIAIDQFSSCAHCGATNSLRPHIVWFGEIPLEMEQIESALVECDAFVAIGTSGNVYPAAGFVQAARFAEADTLELNLDCSTTSHLFSHSVQGPATKVVPALFY